MATNVAVGTRTDLNTTGTKTISLPSNFDPKAIIVWVTKNTADGSIAHSDFCVGFGTYRGGAAQNTCSLIRMLDAAALADDSRATSTTALVRLFTDAAASVTDALSITLVDMQGGATSQVRYSVNTAAAAAWRMHYIIIGGSDVTDAYTSTGSVPASSPEDVTVQSGFGKPDLLFFHHASATIGAAADDSKFGIGFAVQGFGGMSVNFCQEDGNTAALDTVGFDSGKAVKGYISPAATSNGTEVINANLDSAANWPTDGYRMIHNNVTSPGQVYCYLAIKTTSQLAMGADAALTSTGDQDDDVGFAPKGVLMIGSNASTLGTNENAGGGCASLGVGAYDGTNEAFAGFTDSDSATTMVSKMQSSTAKIFQHYLGANTLDAECDGVFTGNIFRRTWTDAALIGRRHAWLVIGDAAGGGTPVSDVIRKSMNRSFKSLIVR